MASGIEPEPEHDIALVPFPVRHPILAGVNRISDFQHTERQHINNREAGRVAVTPLQLGAKGMELVVHSFVGLPGPLYLDLR